VIRDDGSRWMMGRKKGPAALAYCIIHIHISSSLYFAVLLHLFILNKVSHHLPFFLLQVRVVVQFYSFDASMFFLAQLFHFLSSDDFFAPSAYGQIHCKTTTSIFFLWRRTNKNHLLLLVLSILSRRGGSNQS
jgi:hypothetical protein